MGKIQFKVFLLAGTIMSCFISLAAQAQDGNKYDIEAPVEDVGRQATVIELPATSNPPAIPEGAMVTEVPPNELPPRALSREELEQIRKGMVDQTEGAILRPEEVGRIRDAKLGSQSAAVKPTFSTDGYPEPIPRTILVENTPDMMPEKVRLAFGLQTPVSFVDRDGVPWPVASVTYNPSLMAQDGAGCGNNSPQKASVMQPTSINITPCFFEVFTNVNVQLTRWSLPVVFTVQSGFRPTKEEPNVTVDLPVIIALDGISPLAKPKPKPKIVTKSKPQPQKKIVVKIKPVAETASNTLADYIAGRTPSGSRSIPIRGAENLRAYSDINGDLVIVGRADVLAPAWSQRTEAMDAETAYRFRGTPYRVLIVDRDGLERSIEINSP